VGRGAGGVKGIEEQRTSYSEAYEASEQNVRALASRYGAEGVCLGSTNAHSATQSNLPGNHSHEESAKAEATHKKAKQAEKQAG
jgi:hypothetical protein